MLQALVFYLFATILIVSSFRVVTVRNPVHAVLLLVLAFFNAAGLFVLVGAEFLAMVLVVVYVGAVAVLFLFIVMMLDLKAIKVREEVSKALPLAIIVAVVLAVELVLIGVGWGIADPQSLANRGAPKPETMENIKALGMILYTDYLYMFQLAGLVLLVAMIGAIQLVMRKRPHVKKQNVGDQLRRSKADTLEVRKVPTGGGI